MGKQIAWSRVVIEGIVIVVSILLAFGIEAAWAERVARGEEQAALVTLLEEAVANGAQLERVIASVERDHSATRQFFEAEGDGFAMTPLDEADRVLQSLWRPNRARLLSGALNGLAMSGSLAVIGDADLRRLLASWSTEVASIEPRLATLIELEVAIMRALATHADIQRWLMTGASPTELADERSEAEANDTLGDEPPGETVDLRAVRENVEAMAAASAMQFERRIYLRILNARSIQLDELIETLELALR